MAKQLFYGFTTVLVLALCIIMIAVPVSAAGSGNCTRSYNLVLGLSPSGVTEHAVQIVYGSSLHPSDTPGDLRGKVLAADGKILSEFPLWDPRIQFGEDIVVDEKGNVTKTNGILKKEKKATLAVMFPADPDARSFEIYDNAGRVMKNIDLTRADNKATWNCTPDYGIPVRNYSQGLQPGLLTWIIAGLVFLGVAAGTGWYLLRMRSG